MDRLIGFILFPIALFSQSWAERTLLALSLDQKIGQLFMLPVCPPRGEDEDHRSDIAALFEHFYIGNALVKHSDPLTQIHVLNDLQAASKIPLLVAADAGWGLAMRMKDTMAFPKSRTLGRVKEEELLLQLGAELGRQAKRVGIHLNLAPVADVQTNPENPMFGMRAFGQDPFLVAACVSAMVRGMESSGILSCAKHFPGHGDTSLDSHFSLPTVSHSRERLNDVEFVPFRRAIADGVSAVMAAHLLVPALDHEQPATLSFPTLTNVLRGDLGFEGLIISDALNMGALSFQSPEEIATLAFKAGCDLLLYGDNIPHKVDKILRDDIPRAWIALKRGFEDGLLSEEMLNASVMRILKAKERLNLHVSSLLGEEGLFEALHSEEAMQLKKRLFRKAIHWQGSVLISQFEKTAYLSIGSSDEMSKAFHATFSASPNLDTQERSKILSALEEFDAVVIAVHEFGPRDQKYGFSEGCIDLIRSLPDSILCLFGPPESAPLFSHTGPLLIGFENDPDAQEAVLDILMKAKWEREY